MVLARLNKIRVIKKLLACVFMSSETKLVMYRRERAELARKQWKSERKGRKVKKVVGEIRNKGEAITISVGEDKLYANLLIKVKKEVDLEATEIQINKARKTKAGDFDSHHDNDKGSEEGTAYL